MLSELLLILPSMDGSGKKKPINGFRFKSHH